MKVLKSFLLAGSCLLSLLLAAQTSTIRTELLKDAWKAYWIAVPGEPAHDYGVYHFRKVLSLNQKPSSFVVHVSADNRYKLFVNETLVSLGPARGDIAHWNFETVDLAPFLKSGANVISAIVWNEGDSHPQAQISSRTAFILQGNTAAEDSINTNASWKCVRDRSHQPLTPRLVYTYYVTGPGEVVDMRLQDDGWMQAAFNDTAWKASQELYNGLPKGVFVGDGGAWMLVPRAIPQMELTAQRLQAVRKADGITVPTAFPGKKAAIQIPAHTTATLLLDQGFLTNAYPTLIFSGGRDAQLSMGYAEALYIDEGNKDWRGQTQKGNRNEVEGKRFVGKADSVISNGAAQQQFVPLWWRTYRYLQVKVTTADAPLTIDDLYGQFTGYPFQLNARFDADDTLFQNIMQVGWRTARLCAAETYMDCPYYEQLQYVGDTRIQALVSLYNSGDDQLARNAITLLDESRLPEGITQSRYPTDLAQVIPPFSLWWIGMLHDYWMYRPDSEFVKNKLPGLQQVLTFFNRYQQADGSLKNIPYWNFTDWCESKGWNSGVAPVGKNGNSAALDLQLLWAYQLATQLEGVFGRAAYSVEYKTAATQLAQTIQKKYWKAAKGLFADTPEGDTYSQHVNALAILTGLVQGPKATAVAQKILSDTTLAQATIYFKYYVHQALTKVGFGNDYMNWLGIWKENLAQGMTTWAEISDINRARSDCHAWGAHPNIEFFRTVLGIDSDAPGFRHVKVEPNLGKLKKARGEMPHPNGRIQATYEQTASGKWQIEITLPPNTPGTLKWKAKSFPLKPGTQNRFTL